MQFLFDYFAHRAVVTVKFLFLNFFAMLYKKLDSHVAADARKIAFTL